MSFVINTSAKDPVDFSIPMVNGKYVFDITEVKVVPKKKDPKVMQWQITNTVVGLVDEENGFIDDEQAGRTIRTWYQIDFDNPFTKMLFIAVGTEHTKTSEYDTTFTFGDEVTGFDDLPEFLTDKQFVANVTQTKGNNGKTYNQLGIPAMISGEMLEWLAMME